MPRCLIHNDKELDMKLLEVHHKHPTAYGGLDTEENRCTLCPSCHDAVHRISHPFFGGKRGVARDLIAQYLPNQPARRQRLEQLCLIVVDAKRAHTASGHAPEAGDESVETVKMTIEVPAWVHHRLKTATQGHGLYKTVSAYLERLAVQLTAASGGAGDGTPPPPNEVMQQPEAAPVDPAGDDPGDPDGMQLIDLTQQSL